MLNRPLSAYEIRRRLLSGHYDMPTAPSDLTRALQRAARLAGVCLLLIPASIPIAGLIYAIAFNGTLAGQSAFLPYP